jgi:hypothetical protein
MSKRILLLATVAALFPLFGSEARADNIGLISIKGPCGENVGYSNPVVLNPCTLPDGTVIGSQGGTGTASPSSFLLHISPVYVNTRGSGQWVFSTSFGAPGTNTKGSYIELDGFVNLFTKNSSVTLTLNGYSNGGLIDSVTESFPVGTCGKANSCGKPVFAFMYGGPAINAASFTETLTVTIMNGGSYKANGTNPFRGAGVVPEPGTLTLFGTGLLALLGVRRWRA